MHDSIPLGPLVHLEITGMKYAIQRVLSEHLIQMDKHLQAELEKVCSEENVARIVSEEARRQVEAALKEEVRNFFNWSGPGRAAVREAVNEHLSRMYPEKQEEN